MWVNRTLSGSKRTVDPLSVNKRAEMVGKRTLVPLFCSNRRENQPKFANNGSLSAKTSNRLFLELTQVAGIGIPRACRRIKSYEISFKPMAAPSTIAMNKMRRTDLGSL